MAGPTQFVVMHDPHLSGEANVTTVTSEAGPYPTRAVPADTNEGDLLPFLDGTATSDVDAFFQLVRGGGLYAGAQWVWRPSTADADQWLGQNDKRRLVYPTDPFADGLALTYGPCTAYSTAFNRLLCYRISGANTLQIRYRAADASDPTAFTTTTAAIKTSSITADAQTGCVELDDGSMRLFVRTGTTAVGDIDTYRSIDGGLTWLRVARNLYQTWTGASSGAAIGRIKFRRSGDWVRMFWINASGVVKVMVSGDRCASWTELQDLPNAVNTNGDNVDPFGAIDMVGAGDAAGTFVLFIRETGQIQAKAYTASRDEEWVADTNLNQTGGSNLERIVCATGPAFMWALLEFDENAGLGSYFQGLYIRRDHPTDVTYVRSMGTFPGFAGTKRFTCGMADMVFAGSQLVLFSAVTDPDDSGNLVEGTICTNTLGWTGRTVVSTDGYGVSPATMFTDFWSTAWGAPSDLDTDGNPDSPWGKSDSGGAADWNPDRFRLVTTTSGQYLKRFMDEGTAPSDKWADDSAMGFLVYVVENTEDTVDAVAARVTSAGAAGITTDWSLRMSNSQMVVYDNIAGATLTTIAAPLSTGWHEIIATQLKVINYHLQIAHSPIGGATWTAGVTLTLTTGAGTSQIVQWGHLGSTAAGQTSSWRDFWIRGDNDLSLYNFENPTDLNGAVAAPEPTYLTAGLYTVWGGGGGFEGDSFTMLMAHSYRVGNAFMRSPQFEWRSTSGATQYIAMGATGDTTVVEKITADGIAVFKTTDRYVHVEMNDTDSWGSPSFLDTITMDVYTGVTVSATSGTMAQINAPAELLDGELVDFFVRLDTGAADGTTWKISKQIGNRLYCDDETTTLASQGLAAGQTVVIFANRGYKAFSARQVYGYARLTFPGDVETATDDHRLGAFRFGPKVAFDPPLEWEHPDGETPNTNVGRTVSGAGWGLKIGPETRAIVGRYEDFEGVRLAWRNQLKQLSQYDVEPMALVLDDAEGEEVLLVSYQGSTDLQDVAQVQVNGRWRSVGAIELAFLEEV